MRSLFLGLSLLALAAPAVHAQQTGRPTAAAVSGHDHHPARDRHGTDQAMMVPSRVSRPGDEPA